MELRSKLLQSANGYATSGALFQDLKRTVAYRTESTSPTGRIALKSYLDEVITAELSNLGFTVELHEAWNDSPNSFLIGTRFEGEGLPTVLCYGHADVVDGHEGQWADGRSPWVLDDDGERWYGRGAADNKGQHWVNMSALRLLLEEQGHLGFNIKFLFECGEEIGSPALAEFAVTHQRELAANVFIASDGPRLNATTPTIFLGARGGITFELTADLRPDSYHSGNWGGLLRNPATTVAAAIGLFVDGHGRILIPELLPNELPESVRSVLAGIPVGKAKDDPQIDGNWGDTTLSPAEKLYGWNTLEVLALGAADPSKPVNAIPGSAKAVLQLRYVVGTDVDGLEAVLQSHLDQNGFSMVKVKVTTTFPASRLDPDNPWVDWARASIQETTGTSPVVLPNIGGSLPNHVFEKILGLPTLWIPHSYPGCLQHAPNEHMLSAVAEQGLQIACGLFHDLGQHNTTPFAAQAPLTSV
ncbi:M20 family metallopeptidase [Pseudarthrobacter sp. O4]|uniref:M20 family metallopeptidase n=1 Tax=Pseudarthrobacter sp. O4 TaxID=3418417 RepID=UPI003CF95A0C